MTINNQQSDFILLNGQKIFVSDWSLSLFQQCEQLGITIPRFCYHEKLAIAGNCRMCMVELSSSIKPVVACATPLTKGMVVYTDSVLVKKARENVLEFLLINHPLDCPICDQGGECDLQDQALVYGSDRSRFREVKRSVEDKYFGPVVKAIMTRCIHCTRCVRFFEEIAGTGQLGTMGRGKATEIGTYLSQSLGSEVSGNVIDLCPVGALTSKPYAFKARPWELTSIETIDIFDSLCSNIRVDVRGSEVLRILPKLNDHLNEEWITDKIRFSYDGLKIERLSFPLKKVSTGNYISIGWDSVVSEIRNILVSSKGISFMSGELMDLYSSFAFSYFSDSFFSNPQNLIYFNNNNFFNSTDNPLDFLSENSCTSLELDINPFYIFSNFNPVKENPILNTRFRKLFRRGGIQFSYIGINSSFNYSVCHLGISLSNLFNLLKGKHFNSNLLLTSGAVRIFTGSNTHFVNTISSFSRSVFSFLGINSSVNHISATASDVGYLYLGESYKYSNVVLSDKFIHSDICDVVYLNNYNIPLKDFGTSKIIIYQGHHGDRNALLSNYILPITSSFEYSAPYMNFNGFVQWSTRSLFPLGLAKNSYSIFELFSNSLLFNLFNIFFPQNLTSSFYDFSYLRNNSFNFCFGLKTVQYINNVSNNYYLNNIISKHSLLMNRLSISNYNNSNFIF